MWRFRGTLVIAKVLIMVAVGLLAGTAAAGERREDVGVVISTIGSERATTGAGNKIVTHDGKSHVVWQDSTRDGYFNQVRTYDHKSGEWSKTATLNKALDNHARPVITVDYQGYLHVVMSGHNSPITHRRSVRPNDASQWTDAEQVGSGTYPAIVCGLSGTLFVAVRAQSHKGVDLYVRPKEGKWEKSKLLKRGYGYFGYSTFSSGLAFGPDNVLHFVCNVGEGFRGVPGGFPGVHQAVCYTRSRDDGKTWEKADGTVVKLPARLNQLDVLAEATPPPRDLKNNMPEFPELVAAGNVAVDSKGTPYVLYISHLEKPGQLILAVPDDQGKWTQRTIRAAVQKYPDMRPIGNCFSLTIDADDTIHVLLELVPLDASWVHGKPDRRMIFRTEPVKRLVRLASADRGETFTVRTVIQPGTMFNMANAERPTGANTIAAGRVPALIYFDGSCAEGFHNNNVYWVKPR